jgi:spore germination protein
VTPTVPAVPGQQQVYRVQPGDTLYAIALRFNTTIAALEAANDLPNPNRLDVGQEIIIPAN